MKGCYWQASFVLFAAILCGLIVKNVKGISCTEEQIPCDNMQCILINEWCDEEKHCSDGSDEKYCNKNLRWNGESTTEKYERIHPSSENVELDEVSSKHIFHSLEPATEAIASSIHLESSMEANTFSSSSSDLKSKQLSSNILLNSITNLITSSSDETLVAQPSTSVKKQVSLWKITKTVDHHIEAEVQNTEDLQPGSNHYITNDNNYSTYKNITMTGNENLHQQATTAHEQLERQNLNGQNLSESEGQQRNGNETTSAIYHSWKISVAPFHFLQNYTNIFGRKYKHNVLLGEKWLLQNTSRKEHEDIARTIVALSLINNSLSESHEVNLLKKNFDVLLQRALLGEHIKVSLSRLSMYVKAMIALCQDPQDFHERDVLNLLKMLLGSAEQSGSFISPLAYLTLCLAGETKKLDVPYILLQTALRFSKNEKIRDSTILALLALECYLHERRDDIVLQRAVNQGIENLLRHRKKNGSFGNLRSTALAAQALMTSDVPREWDPEQTMDFLQKHQKEDGSFTDALTTFYVLPALSGRSIVHLRNTKCDPPVSNKGKYCERDEIPCDNFQCVKEELFCDGKDDCFDKSDETYCQNKSFWNGWFRRFNCTIVQFICGDEGCVPNLIDCNLGDCCQNGKCNKHRPTSASTRKNEDFKVELIFENFTEISGYGVPTYPSTAGEVPVSPTHSKNSSTKKISSISSSPDLIPKTILSSSRPATKSMENQYVTESYHKNSYFTPSDNHYHYENGKTAENGNDRPPGMEEQWNQQNSGHEIAVHSIWKNASMPFHFSQNYTRILGRKYRHSILLGEQWLLWAQHSSVDQSEDIARILIALSLINDSFVNDTNKNDLIKSFQIGLNTSRNQSSILLSTVALYVNAIVASCHDPENFGGQNFMRLLWTRLDNAGKDSAINPLAYLSLCIAGETAKLEVPHSLIWVSRAISRSKRRQDIKSLVLTALACYLQERKANGVLRDLVDELVESLLLERKEDGSFGNMDSTALAAQALMSSDTRREWDPELTMDFLQKHQEEDGSFGSMLATYYAIPALYGKTLLHLRNVRCH